MITSHSLYRWTGLTFWALVLLGLFVCVRPGPSNDRSRQQLTEYFAKSDERISAVDRSGRLQVGDPVFHQMPDLTWRQVGHVESVTSPEEATVAIRWYSNGVDSSLPLVSYRNRGGLEEVIATMLPEEKRQQIQQRLSVVLRQHGEEMTRRFTPLVENSLRQSLPVIEDEFRRSVERHRDDVDRLASRLNDEVVTERLIPMARREILPIVRKHGEPTAEVIGRELWDRASLWRFGWRIVYDRSPLPERNLTQGEWDRFVDEEAVPVFERHMDEIVVAVQRVLVDVAANSTVRSELADVAGELSRDPQARELVRQILRESLVRNERLRQVWRNIWTSPEAKQAMSIASDRLEPVVRGIGDDLFGTKETGIDPNFARVLRNQILGKDRRWIVAGAFSELGVQSGVVSPEESAPEDKAGLGTREIQASNAFMAFPLVYVADDDSGERRP